MKLVFTGEDFARHARALFADFTRNRRTIAGPPLVLVEATNAVFLRHRRGLLTVLETDAAVADLFGFGVEIAATSDLTQRAYAFAKRHQLSHVYDSHYVVLADLLGTEFWTGDRRLFNNVGAVAPWVRWLGDYPTQ